jgi:arylsulfatase A-like enzyme
MHAPTELHKKWRRAYPQFDDKIGRYSAGKGEDTPDVINPIAGFAAMMENLDNQIGGILNMLIGLGIDDNTIVLFASDNGAHHEGGHDPEFWDSNGPLRGIKRDVYEGGIRTPFLVRWPGKIEAGSVNNHLSAFQDILPTMAELTDQPVPEQNDGISMLPTFLGKTDQKKHDFLYFEFIQGNSKAYTSRALRMGDWKAIQRSANNKGKEFLPIELYDLRKDLGEKNDLAAENPELVQQMEKLMNKSHTPLK